MVSRGRPKKKVVPRVESCSFSTPGNEPVVLNIHVHIHSPIGSESQSVASNAQPVLHLHLDNITKDLISSAISQKLSPSPGKTISAVRGRKSKKSPTASLNSSKDDRRKNTSYQSEVSDSSFDGFNPIYTSSQRQINGTDNLIEKIGNSQSECDSGKNNGNETIIERHVYKQCSSNTYLPLITDETNVEKDNKCKKFHMSLRPRRQDVKNRKPNESSRGKRKSLRLRNSRISLSDTKNYEESSGSLDDVEVENLSCSDEEEINQREEYESVNNALKHKVTKSITKSVSCGENVVYSVPKNTVNDSSCKNDSNNFVQNVPGGEEGNGKSDYSDNELEMSNISKSSISLESDMEENQSEVENITDSFTLLLNASGGKGEMYARVYTPDKIASPEKIVIDEQASSIIDDLNFKELGQRIFAEESNNQILLKCKSFPPNEAPEIPKEVVNSVLNGSDLMGAGNDYKSDNGSKNEEGLIIKSEVDESGNVYDKNSDVLVEMKDELQTREEELESSLKSKTQTSTPIAKETKSTFLHEPESREEESENSLKSKTQTSTPTAKETKSTFLHKPETREEELESSLKSKTQTSTPIAKETKSTFLHEPESREEESESSLKSKTQTSTPIAKETKSTFLHEPETREEELESSLKSKTRTSTPRAKETNSVSEFGDERNLKSRFSNKRFTKARKIKKSLELPSSSSEEEEEWVRKVERCKKRFFSLERINTSLEKSQCSNMTEVQDSGSEDEIFRVGVLLNGKHGRALNSNCNQLNKESVIEESKTNRQNSNTRSRRTSPSELEQSVVDNKSMKEGQRNVVKNSLYDEDESSSVGGEDSVLRIDEDEESEDGGEELKETRKSETFNKDNDDFCHNNRNEMEKEQKIFSLGIGSIKWEREVENKDRKEVDERQEFEAKNAGQFAKENQKNNIGSIFEKLIEVNTIVTNQSKTVSGEGEVDKKSFDEMNRKEKRVEENEEKMDESYDERGNEEIEEEEREEMDCSLNNEGSSRESKMEVSSLSGEGEMEETCKRKKIENIKRTDEENQEERNESVRMISKEKQNCEYRKRAKKSERKLIMLGEERIIDKINKQKREENVNLAQCKSDYENPEQKEGEIDEINSDEEEDDPDRKNDKTISVNCKERKDEILTNIDETKEIADTDGKDSEARSEEKEEKKEETIEHIDEKKRIEDRTRKSSETSSEEEDETIERVGKMKGIDNRDRKSSESDSEEEEEDERKNKTKRKDNRAGCHIETSSEEEEEEDERENKTKRIDNKDRKSSESDSEEEEEEDEDERKNKTKRKDNRAGCHIETSSEEEEEDERENKKKRKGNRAGCHIETSTEEEDEEDERENKTKRIDNKDRKSSETSSEEEDETIKRVDKMKGIDNRDRKSSETDSEEEEEDEGENKTKGIDNRAGCHSETSSEEEDETTERENKTKRIDNKDRKSSETDSEEEEEDERENKPKRIDNRAGCHSETSSQENEKSQNVEYEEKCKIMQRKLNIELIHSSERGKTREIDVKKIKGSFISVDNIASNGYLTKQAKKTRMNCTSPDNVHERWSESESDVSSGVSEVRKVIKALESCPKFAEFRREKNKSTDKYGMDEMLSKFYEQPNMPQPEIRNSFYFKNQKFNSSKSKEKDVIEIQLKKLNRCDKNDFVMGLKNKKIKKSKKKDDLKRKMSQGSMNPPPAKMPKKGNEQKGEEKRDVKKGSENKDYIPLDVSGPTKFSVAKLNKLNSYVEHDAASFKQRMLFGDRVKRFASSKGLYMYKMKQKAGESCSK